jgi:hypothetical protein
MEMVLRRSILHRSWETAAATHGEAEDRPQPRISTTMIMGQEVVLRSVRLPDRRGRVLLPDGKRNIRESCNRSSDREAS